MAFDFQQFLDAHFIPYVTAGSNVARGHINIKCPFCGNRDPSQHLGINLSNGKWGCWRDEKHRSKYPEKLIVELLHCSYELASQITGRGAPLSLSAFENAIESLKNESKEENIKYVEGLEFPREFRKIKREGFTRKFFRYLHNERGFYQNDVSDILYYYDLLCSLTGKYSDRILVPIYRDKILQSWTGRSIYKNEQVRYMTLEKENSVSVITDCIFNYDGIIKESYILDALFIVEGPFDAMKLDYYGNDDYYGAVCIFGSVIYDEQVYQLNELVEELHYLKRVIIMMDDIDISLKIQSKLGFSTDVKAVPYGVDDPGDLSGNQIAKYCQSLG